MSKMKKINYAGFTLRDQGAFHCFARFSEDQSLHDKGERIAACWNGCLDYRNPTVASEVLDLLYQALPFVEDQIDDPVYKEGKRHPRELSKRIRLALETAEGKAL